MKFLVLALAMSASISATAGLFNEYNPWQKTAIRVCFAHTSDDFSTLNYFHDGTLNDLRGDFVGNWQQEAKQKAQQIIESEFSKEKTLIHFVGWQDCPVDVEKSDFDVMLYTSQVELNNIFMEYGRASIGNNSQYDDSIKSKKAFLYIADLSTFALDFKKMKFKGDVELYWKYTLVHEFGHLAGLLHEHDQKDVVNDPNCPEGMVAALIRGTKNFTKLSYTYRHGPYDQNSIMNYCFKNLYRDNNRKLVRQSVLSPQDIETLTKMYSTLEN